MPLRLVVGVNWGDEGKGRMVDYFAKDADFVVRYQGGSNAGHTVVNEFGTFKLHLMPSGIFYKNVVNVIGPGTVVNLEAASGEMEELIKRNVPINDKSYKISDRAIICFPYHKLQDEYEELRLAGKQFGSTKQGIAPAYGDKFMKTAIQIGDILHPEYLKERLENILELKNLIFEKVYNKPTVSSKEMFDWAMQYGNKIKNHICDTVDLFEKAKKEKKNILLEGQLGTLRDITYGIYPYTTSSSTISSYGCAGSGYFSNELREVTGVMKAFSTCVGEGPFVTEMEGEQAKELRETAAEYGAQTGRPRRIGWFDAVASRYGAKVQASTEVAITKLDSLSGQKTLKICTHYQIGNNKTDKFPLSAELNISKPVYIDMPGWSENISGIRKFKDLPKSAREYVLAIEKLIECPIKYVSVGPEREALIIR